MKRKRNYMGVIMLSMSLVIIMALASIFWVIWNGYYRKLIVDPFYEKGSLLLTVVYIIQYLLFSNIYGGFKIGLLKVAEITYSQMLSIIFTNFITYMQISLLAKTLINPSMIFVMFLLDLLAVALWSIACDKLYFSIYPPIKMLIVYGDSSVVNLMSKMRNHEKKYDICAVADISEGLDAVLKDIDNYEAVMLYELESSDRNRIIKYCYKNSIRAYLTPKISDIIINGSEKLHIFDTPLLMYTSKGLTIEQKFIKRIIDIVIALIAVVVLSPFMIITAIAIKIYDGGPVIFKQTRLTANNDIFHMYKFRSMVVDAERNGEARLACENDERVTPLGKIIRKIRFDEIPQFFNILKGDMSIVGPRPERPEIAEQYIEIMPEFEFRTKVKAGLTGYAQVMGKYNTTPIDKLKLDLMYISNYSIFLDLKLILMTIKIVFIAESTEGVAEGEILPEVAVTRIDK